MPAFQASVTGAASPPRVVTLGYKYGDPAGLKRFILEKAVDREFWCNSLA